MFWISNILGLAVAWYFTDLQSPSMVEGIICPILIAVFIFSMFRQLYIAAKSSTAAPNTKAQSNDGGAYLVNPSVDKHKHDGDSDISQSFGGDSGGSDAGGM
ncbi:hypothetical protein N474_23465 [Pseudoalteromonas luteoviolacea CPMOR-2]|uniref:hypothetical protein n=1 Tax=Pseudoalteromonas luteoviolacea TaxID=43657 RepID=UPI0007B07E0F|nr:hypothetical protein [Pseudoalteromonas luteoviolacea]KZN52177.1 hypothetical protein N474_23465 [Pseudoalteromonas luteoviolacea CPMOR-2]